MSTASSAHTGYKAYRRSRIENAERLTVSSKKGLGINANVHMGARCDFIQELLQNLMDGCYEVNGKQIHKLDDADSRDLAVMNVLVEDADQFNQRKLIVTNDNRVLARVDRMHFNKDSGKDQRIHLEFTNYGVNMKRNLLAFGCTSKHGKSYQTGEFGEGLKTAICHCVGKGWMFQIYICFEDSPGKISQELWNFYMDDEKMVKYDILPVVHEKKVVDKFIIMIEAPLSENQIKSGDCDSILDFSEKFDHTFQIRSEKLCEKNELRAERKEWSAVKGLIRITNAHDYPEGSILNPENDIPYGRWDTVPMTLILADDGTPNSGNYFYASGVSIRKKNMLFSYNIQHADLGRERRVISDELAARHIGYCWNTHLRSGTKDNIMMYARKLVNALLYIQDEGIHVLEVDALSYIEEAAERNLRQGFASLGQEFSKFLHASRKDSARDCEEQFKNRIILYHEENIFKKICPPSLHPFQRIEQNYQGMVKNYPKSKKALPSRIKTFFSDIQIDLVDAPEDAGEFQKTPKGKKLVINRNAINSTNSVYLVHKIATACGKTPMDVLPFTEEILAEIKKDRVAMRRMEKTKTISDLRSEVAELKKQLGFADTVVIPPVQTQQQPENEEEVGDSTEEAGDSAEEQPENEEEVDDFAEEVPDSVGPASPELVCPEAPNRYYEIRLQHKENEIKQFGEEFTRMTTELADLQERNEAIIKELEESRKLVDQWKLAYTEVNENFQQSKESEFKLTADLKNCNGKREELQGSLEELEDLYDKYLQRKRARVE